jgi:predicted anti-sigma-YlaC factor YlaD
LNIFLFLNKKNKCTFEEEEVTLITCEEATRRLLLLNLEEEKKESDKKDLELAHHLMNCPKCRVYAIELTRLSATTR